MTVICSWSRIFVLSPLLCEPARSWALCYAKECALVPRTSWQYWSSLRAAPNKRCSAVACSLLPKERALNIYGFSQCQLQRVISFISVKI